MCFSVIVFRVYLVFKKKKKIKKKKFFSILRLEKIRDV